MAYGSLWDDASADLVKEAGIRRLASARLAASPAWAFLANAQDMADFDMRLDYAGPRLAQAAMAACQDDQDETTSVFAALIDSLREDFAVLAAKKDDDKKSAPPFAKDDSDKDSDDDEDEDDEDEDDSDDDSGDRDGDKKELLENLLADDVKKDQKKKSAKSKSDGYGPDANDGEGPDDDEWINRAYQSGAQNSEKSPPNPQSRDINKKQSSWVVIREEGQRKVAGPFEDMGKAHDVAKAKGPGYTVESVGGE